jgi:WD40 repeat protein
MFEVAGDAPVVDVETMSADESMRLMQCRVGKAMEAADRANFATLAARLDHWPLLLELAAATLRHRLDRRDTLSGAVRYLETKLQKQGMVAFDQRNPSDRGQAFAKTIECSLDLLDTEERERLSELSIFPEDTPLPLATVSTLWGLDAFDSEEQVLRFDGLSLLRFSLSDDQIRLHDVIRDYLGASVANPVALHSRLLDGWGDPLELSDGYAWRWIAHHLLAAGRADELRRLLLDPHWLEAKLAACGSVPDLIEDFNGLPDEKDLESLRDAIRLSAHVIASDARQLPSQLLGRLGLAKAPALQQLCRDAESHVLCDWLKPLNAVLTPPGGALLFTFTGHQGRVHDVAITPDGRHALSAGDDGSVRVWDLDMGAETGRLEGHTDWVRHVVVSPDGRRAASASDDHRIRVWRLRDLELEFEIDTDGDWVRALTFFQNGRRLAAASDDGSVRIFDSETGDEVPGLPKRRPVRALAALPQGQLLTIADDRVLRAWDPRTEGECACLAGGGAAANDVACIESASAVTAHTDGELRVWEIDSGSVRSIQGWPTGLRCLALTPTGDRAVVGTEDSTLDIFDLHNDQPPERLEGHNDWVNAVAIHPAGQRVLSASNDGTVKLWSLDRSVVAAQIEQAERHRDRVRAVAVCPDASFALSVSDDGKLARWDASNGGLIDERDLEAWGLALIEGGRRLIAVGGDATVRILDLENAGEEVILGGHGDRIRALSVARNERLAVSAGDDGCMRVWDIPGARQRLEIRIRGVKARGLALDPEGRWLALASDGKRIKLWDLEDGEAMSELRGHSARINALAVFGSTLASASDDGTVRLWDVAHNAPLNCLEGHADRVVALAPLEGGRLIISASRDRTLRIWRAADGKQLATYTADSPFVCCSATQAASTIVAGDEAGGVHFLHAQGPELEIQEAGNRS